MTALEKEKSAGQNFVRSQPLTKKEWDTQLALLIPESKAAVQRFLDAGREWHEIILPGSAKGMFVYVAPDFDEPMEDFAEYM
jgi:hypothetical protein